LLHNGGTILSHILHLILLMMAYLSIYVSHYISRIADLILYTSKAIPCRYISQYVYVI
jgi:hypothetical protein